MCAWFLEIALSEKSVCACVYLPPGYEKSNYSCEMKSQTSPTAFRCLCMALAIDTIDGWDLSNEVRRELPAMPQFVKVFSHHCFVL